MQKQMQEIPGVIGNFGHGVQNKAGQRLTEFCQEKHTDHSKFTLPTTPETALHMDINKMVSTEIMVLFAAENGERST